MRLTKIITFIIITFIFINSTVPNAIDQWRLRKNRNGISVYTRKVIESPINELKGECIVNASLNVVTQVIFDIDSYPEWVADCKESRKVNSKDYFNYSLYYLLDLPWPVQDRDVILESTTEINLSEGVIIGTLSAISSLEIPKRKRCTRVTLMNGQWIFKRISENKTKVTLLCWADPDGHIPVFIVNIASKNIPYRTLTGLRKMVKKNKYIEAAKKISFKRIKFISKRENDLNKF